MGNLIKRVADKRVPLYFVDPWVVFLSYCGTTLSRLGGIMTGLVVYSYFKDCHPLLTKNIPSTYLYEFKSEKCIYEFAPQSVTGEKGCDLLERYITIFGFRVGFLYARVHVEKVMSMCFVPDAFSISYSDPLGEGCGVWTWGNNYGAGVVFLTDSKKEITNPDQIVAQFIKKIAEVIPGVLGLFCAGVVAASLSTMSSCLNTMACSVHDDLVLRLTSGPIPQKLSFLIMKGLIFLFGIGALAFTPLYSGVQSFLQVIISTNAVINSGFLGMFISSMVNPWVTSKGLITGAAAGTAVPMLLALNFMQLESQGKLVYYPKLVTTTGCNQPRFGGNFTRTLNYGFGGQGTTVFMDFTDFLSKLSAVSFQWYLPIGITVSFVVSAIVSFCAGGQDLSDVDPRLIIPHLRWILPKEVPPQRDQDDQESVPLKIIDDPKKDVAGISG